MNLETTQELVKNDHVLRRYIRMRGENRKPNRVLKGRGMSISIAVMVLSAVILACKLPLPQTTPATGELIIIEDVIPRGISANGKWVVGAIDTKPFKWSEQTGIVELSGMGTAYAVSDDGRVVVGNKSCPRSGAKYNYMDDRLDWYENYPHHEATLWMEGSIGMPLRGQFDCTNFDYDSFGVLDGRSIARDVSPDGQIVVGVSTRYVLGGFCNSIMTNPDYICDVEPDEFKIQAVVWQLDFSDSNVEIHETILPGLSDHHFWGSAIAAGTTATVVGGDRPPPWSSSDPYKYQQPFRAVGDCSVIPCSWQTNVLLGSPSEQSSYASAVDISQDQSTVVGNYLLPDNVFFTGPFKWTADNGLELLGGIDGGDSQENQARAVSADGRVIVGQSWSEVEDHVVAAVWTPLFGAESLRQLLIDRYNMSAVMEECVIEEAIDISDDGRTILAYGYCIVEDGRDEGALVIKLSKPPNFGYVPQGE